MYYDVPTFCNSTQRDSRRRRGNSSSRMELQLKMPLRICLLLGIVIVLKGQENGTDVDHFWVDCDGFDIDSFNYYCHKGIRKACDESICMLSKEEPARKRCALFCDQVKNRLTKLPKRVAELEKAHEELITDNSNLKEDLVTQNESISEERRQTEDLRTQLQIYKTLTIVLAAMLGVALLIFVIVLVVKIHCKGQRSGTSDVCDPFILKNSKGQTIETDGDSAIESDLHKCEEKVKPTDDEQSAPLAVTELQQLPSRINREL